MVGALDDKNWQEVPSEISGVSILSMAVVVAVDEQGAMGASKSNLVLEVPKERDKTFQSRFRIY